jgi:DNA-binding transcriptional MerR regulator
LEEFVAEVNSRLERSLPGEVSDARQREDFTVRLLRHYGSLGLVDESERVGREALYRYRHLLQVLALRQLQREGWNSKAIAGFTARPDAELEDFLNGRDPAQANQKYAGGMVASAPPEMDGDLPAFAAAAPAPAAGSKVAALEFLDSVRKRAAPPAQVPAPSATFPLHAPQPSAQTWQRLEVAPGLELHVAQHYRPARTGADKKRLLEAVETALETLDPQR